MSSWDLLEGGQSLLAAVHDGVTVAFRDGATLADPVRTTNVQNLRAMTTWCLLRPA